MSRVKRGEMKARRQRQRQAQRRGVLIAGVGIVVVIIAVIAGTQIYQNTRPVGEIKTATLLEYPAINETGMGDPNAPVKIEVFEDFQCPACRDFGGNAETRIISEMKDLIESGKVYYQYRHFPFLDDRSATRESDMAANASMCAAEQDKFWEMKATIFANWNGENQGAYSTRRLKAMGAQVVPDTDRFDSCLDSRKYQGEIDDDYDEGKRRGVTGTPTVFVNGEVLSPGFVPPYEDIKAKVDAILGTSQ